MLKGNETDKKFTGQNYITKIMLNVYFYRAAYDNLRIMVGSSSLIKPGKRYQVEDVIINDYKEYDRTGDLALVKTLGDIEFDNLVQPINITSKNYNEAGYPAVLTGWGRLNVRK